MSATIYKTYKFKLKVSKTQEVVLNRWLGTCRFLYNAMKEYKDFLYNQRKINISEFDMSKQLTLLKKTEGCEWFKEVYSQVLTDVVKRLYFAYDAFYKRGAGFPKYAKKGLYNSFSYSQNVVWTDGKIKLPKLAEFKYFRDGRFSTGKIKTATVCKDITGWFISLVVEEPSCPLPEINKQVALDMGIKVFAHTSDGKVVDKPKYTHKYEAKLRVLNRSLARKKKGSYRWRETKRQLGVLHRKIANCRKDFLHKVSSKLINENQVIVIEDIKVSDMIKKLPDNLTRVGKANISKALLDQGWANFVSMLEYKAVWYGRHLVKVPPEGTTEKCSTSGCTYSYTDIKLTVRSWTCPECNTTHHRDINAAKNILGQGLSLTR